MTSTDTRNDLLWPPYSGPADTPAIEAVDLAERGIPATTWEVVEYARANYGGRTATHLLASGAEWDQPIVWTFDELCANITRAANVFTSLGVTRGVPVTFMGVNTGLLLAATVAAQTVGIAAPVNPTLSTDHIIALVDKVQSKVIVAAGPELNEELWNGACQLAALAGIGHVLALRPDHATGPGPALSAPDGVEVAYLEDLMADQPGDTLVADPPSPDDIASYFHTGGTTGMPKVAAHLQRNVTTMAWLMGIVIPVPVPSTILAGLPLFHVNALMVTGIMPLLRGHSTVWTGPLGFRDQALYGNLWKIIERYRCASMSAVPTVYGVLNGIPVDADLSSLKVPVVGAAPLPPSVAEAWEAHTGVPLCEGYGLTESTTASAFTPPGGQRAGSCGVRVAYQHIKTVQVGADGSWTDLPPGSPGLVVIDGPTIFPGYLQVDEDGTRRLDASKDVRDGWLDTGDLGVVDEDGYLFLTGRAKDLIIRGGHNIDPATIEDAMLDHPAVTGAGAVGRPDAHAGEVPVAYVTVSGDVSVDELREWAGTHVTEKAAVPRDVYVIDEIPLTAVGKPFKPALREDAFVRLLTDEMTAAGVDLGPGAIEARHDAGQLVAAVTVDNEAAATTVKSVAERYTVPVSVKVS